MIDLIEMHTFKKMKCKDCGYEEPIDHTPTLNEFNKFKRGCKCQLIKERPI